MTCIEGNGENIEVAKAVVERAFGKGSEVLDRWKVVQGLSSDVLKDASKVEALTGSPCKPFDFVFLDHDKSCLLPDTRTLESQGYLAESATLVADNVIFPGAPDFLEYVGAGQIGVARESKASPTMTVLEPSWDTKLYPFPFERVGFETGFTQREDAMSVSSRILRPRVN